jgi:hypothetical protein
MNKFFRKLGVEVWPEVITIKRTDNHGLKGLDGFLDCPIIPIPSSHKHPVFKDVSALAFNRPVFFDLGSRGVLLRSPAGCNFQNAPLLAVYKQDLGRGIAVADHSPFINSMLSKEDNLRFFQNCLAWLDHDQSISNVLVCCDGRLQAAPANARPRFDDLPTLAQLNLALSVLERSGVYNKKISSTVTDWFWTFWYSTGPSMIVSGLLFAFLLLYIVRRRETAKNIRWARSGGIPGILRMRAILAKKWKKIPISLIETMDDGFRRSLIREYSLNSDAEIESQISALAINQSVQLRVLAVLRDGQRWLGKAKPVKLRTFRHYQTEMVAVLKIMQQRPGTQSH